MPTTPDRIRFRIFLIRRVRAAMQARARAEAAVNACCSSLDRDLPPAKRASVERMGLARLADFERADAELTAFLGEIRWQFAHVEAV